MSQLRPGDVENAPSGGASSSKFSGMQSYSADRMGEALAALMGQADDNVGSVSQSPDLSDLRALSSGLTVPSTEGRRVYSTDAVREPSARNKPRGGGTSHAGPSKSKRRNGSAKRVARRGESLPALPTRDRESSVVGKQMVGHVQAMLNAYERKTNSSAVLPSLPERDRASVYLSPDEVKMALDEDSGGVSGDGSGSGGVGRTRAATTGAIVDKNVPLHRQRLVEARALLRTSLLESGGDPGESIDDGAEDGEDSRKSRRRRGTSKKTPPAHAERSRSPKPEEDDLTDLRALAQGFKFNDKSPQREVLEPLEPHEHIRKKKKRRSTRTRRDKDAIGGGQERDPRSTRDTSPSSHSPVLTRLRENLVRRTSSGSDISGRHHTLNRSSSDNDTLMEEKRKRTSKAFGTSSRGKAQKNASKAFGTSSQDRSRKKKSDEWNDLSESAPPQKTKSSKSKRSNIRRGAVANDSAVFLLSGKSHLEKMEYYQKRRKLAQGRIGQLEDILQVLRHRRTLYTVSLTHGVDVDDDDVDDDDDDVNAVQGDGIPRGGESPVFKRRGLDALVKDLPGLSTELSAFRSTQSMESTGGEEHNNANEHEEEEEEENVHTTDERLNAPPHGKSSKKSQEMPSLALQSIAEVPKEYLEEELFSPPPPERKCPSLPPSAHSPVVDEAKEAKLLREEDHTSDEEDMDEDEDMEVDEDREISLGQLWKATILLGASIVQSSPMMLDAISHRHHGGGASSTPLSSSSTPSKASPSSGGGDADGGESQRKSRREKREPSRTPVGMFARVTQSSRPRAGRKRSHTNVASSHPSLLPT